jgi:K+-transporting ATPase ATPase C chain
MSVRSQVRPAVVLLLAFTAITGVLYPAVVTGVARLLWRDRAEGSVIVVRGRATGSRLIGQRFDEPQYFWGRPSATNPVPYDGAASGGSNLGPSNPALTDSVRARIAALRGADSTATGPPPVDLVTASGSGLDPDISPAAAYYQAARVARARGWSPEAVALLIRAHVRGRTWSVLGEPAVNVLELNLALDEAAGHAAPHPSPDRRMW